MKKKLLVVGYCYMEMVVWTDAIPTADVVVSDHNSYTLRSGGRAGCAAVAACRMGLDVSLCSAVGKDANGSRLLEYYNSNGIDTGNVLSDRRGTGISVHLHENSFDTDRKILCTGANAALSVEQISHAMESEPDGVFVTTDLPGEMITEIAHLARIHGIPVYMDAAGMRPFATMSKLENVTLFITDTAGVKNLTGTQITTADKCLPAAIALAGKIHSRYYIFRLGTMGTFIYDGKYQYHVIPCSLDGHSVGAPIDTEAAAIASAYHTTGDIRNSCALAAVMAKMAREDPKIRIPTMAQAVDYCRINGIRFTK